MKRLNLYLITMLLVAIPMLQSCDDDGEYEVRPVVMATVHLDSGNAYYLELDNGKKLWPEATEIPWYKPVDGQRTWANFTVLNDETPEDGFDHDVKVNFLFNVLTKNVEELTAENEEEIGDDPAYIEEMWIGGNYLNMQFVINVPVNELHRVSLVENTIDNEPLIDDEGYVCLEYRYNRADQVYNAPRRSYVSYNLGEYGPLRLADNAAIKGLKVKINSIANGERVIVFDYTKDNNEKAVSLDSEVVNEGAR